jgi:hypothetical protein
VATILKKDIPGNISDAEVKWTEIKDVAPADLQKKRWGREIRAPVHLCSK